jgi:hypothetical protein
MKIIIACLITFLISGRGPFPLQQQEFSWLVGKWKLTDKNVYEEWQLSTDGETWKGRSYKIKGADTTVTESITLMKEDGHYFYVPFAQGNSAPVKFQITSMTRQSFVAENHEHDFPKIIRYKLFRKNEQDVIEAAIEGNGKVIQYTFVRVQ